MADQSLQTLPNPRAFFLPPDSVEKGSVVRRGTQNGVEGWWLHRSPHATLVAKQLSEVRDVLEQAETHAAAGGLACGFVSYEASPAFESKISVRESGWPALAWFALFEDDAEFYYELTPAPLQAPVKSSTLTTGEYAQQFEKVHEALGGGEAYQVNFTFREQFKHPQNSLEFFSQTCGVQPPPFATYIHGGSWQIASFSPELFFSRAGDTVCMRPMKGTAPISANVGFRNNLADYSDEKTVAENIMIVDMVRNDLGRIAVPGTVVVPELLTVETHRTVIQVTSTVRAEVTASTKDLFGAIFPPASVTGAPKIAACQLITDIESSPRNVYCGAIGTLGPGNVSEFSVGIRTALFQGPDGFEYGVGSGLIWDSNAHDEYEECLLKAAVVETPAPQWGLIESIPLELDGSMPGLQYHMQRLSASAATFGVPFSSGEACAQCLAAAARAFPHFGRQKLRLVLSKDGSLTISISEPAFGLGPIRAVIGVGAVHSRDLRLRHKTTNRTLFDQALNRHPDSDEVLLFNEQEEATCFCRGNLVARIDGKLLTPRVESGCLAGVGLRRIRDEQDVQFATLGIDDLLRASDIYLSNAVSGLLGVELFNRCPPSRR